MRIQIADDDGNVVYVPALNQHLERDLRSLFGEPSLLRPLKRAHNKYALERIEEVTKELREATRF